MDPGTTNMLLMLLLLACVIAMFIMWIKNKKMKKKITKYKKGELPLSLFDKILIALKLRDKPRPPHSGFEKGDVNIRVW